MIFATVVSGGAFHLFCRPGDGSGPVERLTTGENDDVPSSWLPDGRILAFVSERQGAARIRLLSLGSGSTGSRPSTEFPGAHPELSPDGRWLAYVSDRSGRFEVYVESFPDRGDKIQVSNAGGLVPCWSRDRSRLYYVTNVHTLMVVDAAARPRFGVPRTVLDCFGYLYTSIPVRPYDVDPKGRLLTAGLLFGGRPVWRRDFPDAWKIYSTGSHDDRARLERWLKGDPERRLAPTLEGRLRQTPTTRINIVENWFADLDRLVPAAGAAK